MVDLWPKVYLTSLSAPPKTVGVMNPGVQATMYSLATQGYLGFMFISN